MPLLARLRLSLRAFRVSGANTGLRLVQLARLASVTGRWAYTVTLAVFAYRSGGATGVAIAGLVRLGPATLTAPLAGALVRRMSLSALLVGGGLVRTAALAGAGLVVLSGWSSVLVYALVALESATSALLRPVQNALLPALSRTPEELTTTNLALSVIESAGVFLGPLVGAALLHGTSVGIVFIAAAGAYLVSALLTIPLRDVEIPVSAADHSTGLAREALAGARDVWHEPTSRTVLVLYGAQNLVAGALNVLLVVTALDVLDMGDSGVGTLTAAVGVGGVVGGIVVFSRIRSGRHGVDLAVGLLLWGIPLALLAASSSEAVAIVLLGIVGVGVTMVDVAALTLVQRSADERLLAHALGLLQTVFLAGVAVGTMLAPLLVAWLGARGALVVAGAALPVLALAFWRSLRRLDDERVHRPELVRLLAGSPIFAPLADATLEHLAGMLRRVETTSGTTIFAQGDRGDGFYLLQSGVVDVLVDGVAVRSLHAGDGFGEIALLRDVPRTAGVVARDDVVLQRLDREHFLAAVAGDPSSSRAADAVVGARLGARAPWPVVADVKGG